MTYRPKPKYASRDAHRGPWTQCSDCGFQWSQTDMAFQYDYVGGPSPINLGYLRCPRCITPFTEQRRLIIIPPDPPVFFNTRPENYVVDEANFLTTTADEIYQTQGGDDYISSIPNPAQNAATSYLLCSMLYPSGSVAAAYLDLFLGNPAAGGTSILSLITGSSTRTNIASQLTLPLTNIAINTQPITISAASESTTNINWVGIYNAASGGTLLTHATVSAAMSIAAGNAVVFDTEALSINLN